MWVCKKCKEELDDSFDSCWKCGYENKSKIESEKNGTNEKDNPSILQPTYIEINRENKKIMQFKLSFKYSSLRIFRILAYLQMILGTFGILWFLFFSSISETLSSALNFAVYGIPYFLIMFYNFSFINIVDFLYDLDEKTDN